MFYSNKARTHIVNTKDVWCIQKEHAFLGNTEQWNIHVTHSDGRNVYWEYDTEEECDAEFKELEKTLTQKIGG